MLCVNFPPKFDFLGNLKNNLVCLNLFLFFFLTKNQFVEKFQLKDVLFENFHKHLLVGKRKKWGKISTTICFVKKISTKIPFLKNFHKIMLCWKIITNKCFVGKFPQKYALFDNFHKKTPCWKITRKQLPPSPTAAPPPPPPLKCPNSS